MCANVFAIALAYLCLSLSLRYFGSFLFLFYRRLRRRFFLFPISWILNWRQLAGYFFVKYQEPSCSYIIHLVKYSTLFREVFCKRKDKNYHFNFKKLKITNSCFWKWDNYYKKIYTSYCMENMQCFDRPRGEFTSLETTSILSPYYVYLFYYLREMCK